MEKLEANDESRGKYNHLGIYSAPQMALWVQKGLTSTSSRSSSALVITLPVAES